MLLLLLLGFAAIIFAALLWCDPPLSSTRACKTQTWSFSYSRTSAEHGWRITCLGLTSYTAVYLSQRDSPLA